MHSHLYTITTIDANGVIIDRMEMCTSAATDWLMERIKTGPDEITATIHNAAGELVGEILNGTDTTIPAEYRNGWYNVEDFPALS